MSADLGAAASRLATAVRFSRLRPSARQSASAAFRTLLVVAREQTISAEILLWMTPSETSKASQASECSELLDPTGASCWSFAQR